MGHARLMFGTATYPACGANVGLLTGVFGSTRPDQVVMWNLLLWFYSEANSPQTPTPLDRSDTVHSVNKIPHVNFSDATKEVGISAGRSSKKVCEIFKNWTNLIS